MGIQLLHTDDDSYHIDNGSGQPIQIAKNSLDPALMAQLDAMKPLSAQTAPTQDPGSLPYGTGNTVYGTDQLAPTEGASPAPQTDSLSLGQAAPAPAMGLSSKDEAAAGAPPKVDTSAIAFGGSKPADIQQPGSDLMKSMQAGNDLQMKGIQDLTGAEQAGAKQKSAAFDNLSKNLADSNQQTAQLNQKIQAFQETGMADLQKRSDEVVKASQIDPNRFYENMDTGNKIMAAISLALGGIGGALTGHGGNVALDIINKSIDRDIEAQKANANAKQRGLDNQTNLYQMNLKAYGDQRLALEATRSQMIQMTQAQVSSIDARMGGAKAGGQAEMLMGQLKNQNTQSQAALSMQLAQRGALMHAAQGGAVTPEALTAMPPEWQKKAVSMPDGTYRFASQGEKQAEETNKFTQSYKGAKDMLSQLQALKFAVPGTEQAKQAQQIMGMLKPTLNELNGLSRFTAEENKVIYDPAIADPTSFLQGRNHRLLENLESIIDRKADSVYGTNVLGYKPLKLGAPTTVAKR